MWQLYQFPLCPFSRKVRLMLAEKGVAHELVRESPWLKRDEFTDLNPAGQTPVLVEEARGIVLIDSKAICEYFEETVDRSPMIPGTAPNRAEVRRLVSWFDEGLYGEVVAPLMEERMTKSLVARCPPDTTCSTRCSTPTASGPVVALHHASPSSTGPKYRRKASSFSSATTSSARDSSV